MMKKIIFALVLVLAVFSAAAVSADSGISWSYDEATKTVTVTGSGALNDSTPFNDYDGNAEKIVISEGITSIGRSVFSYITGVKSVILPTTLKTIEKKAFYYSGTIESIELPEGLENIESEAFEGCASLKTLTIPKTVSSIGENVFGECYKLEKICVADGNEVFSDTDGVLMNRLKDTIIAYPAGKPSEEYVVPSGVKTVGNGAFSFCVGLKSVRISQEVESIGDSAFYFCKNLERIKFDGALKSIGNLAFYGCGFKTVTLSLGMESIGDSAFKNCRNLSYVYIPNTVKAIGSDAFYGTDLGLVIGCYNGGFAQQYANKSSINAKNVIGVEIDGRGTIEFDEPATLIGDYTMVPMRRIFEELGADVSWDEKTQTATGVTDGVTVSISIGGSVLYKNGAAVPLSAPAALVNDRTLVPLRAVSEAFGAEVEWDGTNGYVRILQGK